MFHTCALVRWLLPVLLFACGVVPAQGVITKLTPLSGVISDSDDIVVAKVDAVDPGRPSVILTVERRLKGESAIQRYAVNLKGDSEGNPKHVLDRVEPGTLLLLFVTDLGERHQALAFVDGSWFQILGLAVDQDVRWGFTHAEPFLRRTFKGTTAELEKIVVDVLAKKGDAPAPVGSETPGLGPKIDGTTEAWTVATHTHEPTKSNTQPVDSAIVGDGSAAKAAPVTAPVPASASVPADAPKGFAMTTLGIIGGVLALIVVVVLMKKRSA